LQPFQFYFDIFLTDLKKLNILTPNIWPKASEHIKEQIDMIKNLEKKGYTYKTSDGIYFDSKKFKDYGKLARLKIEELEAGASGAIVLAMDEKKHKTDFALWKFSDTKGSVRRQQEWKSPWGIGFPGWHIECSAMSKKYLGNNFDIHTGGEDLIPVHHTNEIAQSESATGKKFVNYWLHGAFVLHRGEKISKSTGGLYTLSELEEKGYNALHFRYMTLLTHYRKPLGFSLESLDSAKNVYERIERKIIELKKEEHKGNDKSLLYEKKFLEAINDNLNMPRAIKVFWQVLDDFDFSPKKKIKLLENFDRVLGLGISNVREEEIKIPTEVKKLISAREEARKKKMWVEADILRQRIKERGFILEDTAKGPKVREA